MRRGFTLIELLVAISLLVILGTAGVIGYRNAARRQALEAAVEKTVGTLRYIQANAAGGVKDEIACGTTRLTGWRVQFAVNNYTLEGLCGAITFNRRTESYSGEVIGITATGLPSPNPILFKVLNQGTNIGNSTTLTLSGYGLTRTVTINSSGQIR